METDYPHDGAVRVTVKPSRPAEFNLVLRIPAWISKGTCSISDDTPIEVNCGAYHIIDRLWQPETHIVLDFEMPVRAIQSKPEIVANRDQIAFAKGPLIYCAEQTDIDLPLESLRLPPQFENAATAEWRPDFLGGVHVLHLPLSSASVHLIPYYARANRSKSSQWITLIKQSHTENDT